MRDIGPDDDINTSANTPLEVSPVDLGDDETVTDPMGEPEETMDDGSDSGSGGDDDD